MSAPARRARLHAVVLLAACFVAYPSVAPRAAYVYPMTLTLEASGNVAGSAVKSAVTIHVDRLMEESRRKRVTDTLMYNGYANFLNALKAIPAIGTIGLQGRTVDVRYAAEQTGANGPRLVLVADHPLFFLGGDPAKTRAGYELTIVELRFDAAGGVTGTMAGAARVKPSPGGIVLDDFAENPVSLVGRAAATK